MSPRPPSCLHCPPHVSTVNLPRVGQQIQSGLGHVVDRDVEEAASCYVCYVCMLCKSSGPGT